ncbi:MAG TPA: hypothetical protein VHE30_29805 [Polyangiaceae bacterium]|nr:hypothetical protein [Polyangiaceae bacterium]
MPRDALFRVLAFVAILLAGCQADRASSPRGGAAFGEPCLRTEDCASRLCLRVSDTLAVCTSACATQAACPAVPGWACVAPSEIPSEVCACRATAEQEICGNGVDDDCDGKADDCRICGGRAVADDDHENCGSCGNACTRVQACVSGTCQCPIQMPLECGTDCVNPDADSANCGACGHRCPTGQSCVSGTCACPDASRPDLCDGVGCVDLDTDPGNCGACGAACASPRACSAGKCACSDPDLPDYCDSGGCVDLSTDPNHCGACDTVCGVDQRCDAGQCRCPAGSPDSCDGSCVDLSSDPNHCGTCENVCASTLVCSNGACACPDASRVPCNGTCVDTQTDSFNCGACGHSCAPAEDCVGGLCTCPSGLVCGGACVPLGDHGNCGGCGHACGSSQTCVGTECTCPFNLTVCGSDCADTSTDVSHCGTCDVACGPNQLCVAGTCADVTCVASTEFCSGGSPFLCDSTGTSAVLVQACSAAQYCAVSQGFAACYTDVCEQGLPVCNGTVATTCAADGSRMQPGGTDCSLSGKACDSGACRPVVCTPNQESCSGQTAQHCNALGTVLSSETCPADQFCKVQGTATCLPDVCTANALVCDQNVATSCAADGSGFTGSRTDCTTGSASCRDGYCWGFTQPVLLGSSERIYGLTGASDTAGNVVLLWAEGTISGTTWTPRFSRFDHATSTWSPEATPNGVTDGSTPLAVVGLSTGSFVAVWTTSSGAQADVLDPKTSKWSPLKTMSAARAGYVRLAVDGTDRVTAAWTSNQAVYVSRRNPVSDTWSTPQTLPNTVANDSANEFPGVGASSSGDTLVSWVTSRGTANANRFDATAGTWAATSTTLASAQALYRYANLNVRPDGRAIATWQVYSSPPTFSSYDPTAKTWSAAAAYSTDFSRGLFVVSRGASRVLAYLGAGDGSIRGSWFDDGTGAFETPRRFYSTLLSMDNPAGAVGGDGSALVAAAQNGQIWVTRYDPPTGLWSPGDQLNGGYLSDSLEVWMDAIGAGVVTWHQSEYSLTVEEVAAATYARYR